MLSNEVLGKVNRALQKQGYIISQKNNADYHLTFDFGMTHTSIIVDVPHNIPGPEERTLACIQGLGGPIWYTKKTQTTAGVVYIPEERITFHKTLNIVVHQTGSYTTRQGHLVWKTAAYNSDNDNDLRKAMNHLIGTAFKHFGRNSQK